MKKPWKIVAITAFVAFLVVGTLVYQVATLPVASTSAAGESTSTVTVNGTVVKVDVAVTPAQQSLGLGGRASLAPDTGMLFVFPGDGEFAFWMKDMSFPIDIIWLADDGAVVYIVPDLSPSTYPNSYAPRSPARYVLEVPAGFAAENNVKIGDIVTLP